MTFSVIVPVYNVERYVRKCINSLLNQDYDDYEILIIDDGSTDGSGIICDEIATENSNRVKVIHQTNKGLGGARNTGINNASGDFLVFVDSDDYVDTKLLSISNSYIKKYCLDILKFNYYLISEKGHIYGSFFSSMEPNFKMLDTKEFLISDPTAWNKIYKRTLFVDNAIEYPERLLYEDLATTPKFALHAKHIGQITAPLYFYLQRQNSIMREANIKKLLQITQCIDIILAYYQKSNMFQPYYRELEWLTVQHILYYTIKRILMIKYDLSAIKELEKYITYPFPDYLQNPYLNHDNDTINPKELSFILQKKYRYVQIKYLNGIRFRKRFKQICSNFKRLSH